MDDDLIPIAAAHFFRSVLHEAFAEEGEGVGAALADVWPGLRNIEPGHRGGGSWAVLFRKRLDCCVERFDEESAGLGRQSGFENQTTVVIEVVTNRAIGSLLLGA